MSDAATQRGRFITFEGGEGAGKSTQVRLLVGKLVQAGIKAVATREPGGSPGAEAIRELILNGEPESWDRETEALLMIAARRDHVTHMVHPTLNTGQWVVCDRFGDSTLAYQGYGRGITLERLRELHRFVCDGLFPDLTLVLDIPVEQGLARASAQTRFERMGKDFHERMRQGFLDIARNTPQRCVVIDATKDVTTVQAAVAAAVRDRLKIAL